MSTTSLKLPDALKNDIQRFAAEEDLTAHAFMVRTLEAEARRRRLRAEFIADAVAAAADIDAGGPVYDLDDVARHLKAHLRAKVTGETVVPPTPVRGRGAPQKKMRQKKAA